MTEINPQVALQPPFFHGEGYKVEIENLSYRPFGVSGRDILQTITLALGPGEFVALVGPNGAGKSSILRAISGEVLPTSGSVRVGGQKVDRPINQLLDGIGIVHQVEDSDLIDHLTIAHNISIRQLLGGGHPEKIWAMPASWRRKVATFLASHSALAAFDLDTIVGTMSGGERQLLSIAIATRLEHHQNPCRLLLLDEHTSRLDPQNASAVMRYTKDQVRSTQATTLMITHRYKDALEGTDRVIVLRNGKLEADLKTSDIESVESLSLLVNGSAEP